MTIFLAILAAIAVVLILGFCGTVMLLDRYIGLDDETV